LVKFIAPTGEYFNTLDSNKRVVGTASTLGSTTTIWAEVVSVVDDGTGVSSTGVTAAGYGAVTLNKTIPSGAIISQIIPKWRTVIDSSVITTMIDLVFANKPFGLSYNSVTQSWQIIFEVNLDAVGPFSLAKQGDNTNQKQDSSWMLLFTTDNITYTITTREQRYIFESNNQIRFYFDSSKKIYDSKSGTIVKDQINVLSINKQPRSTVDPLGTSPFTIDQQWDIVAEYVGLDGYVDNKKLVVSFADSDDDGVVDNPELF